MPRLVAQSQEFVGQTFDLSGQEITVGRVADNKIQIEHASISGHHAVLKLDGQDYLIKDLDSTNGTRINGEKITEQKLRRNDMLRLGNIELLYDSEHAPPGRPMPGLSERVNLAECSSKGRAADFVNASPIVKKARGGTSKTWTIVLSVLAAAALGGIGYFVWVVFLTDHSHLGG
jgi:predicted component of type VI protein secretion system